MAKGDASGGGVGNGATPSAPKMDQYSVMHMIMDRLGQSGMSPSMNFNPGQPQQSMPFQGRQPGPRMGFGGNTGAPQQFTGSSPGMNTFGPMQQQPNQLGMAPNPDLVNRFTGGMGNANQQY